jgi:hypothetical protein
MMFTLLLSVMRHAARPAGENLDLPQAADGNFADGPAIL